MGRRINDVLSRVWAIAALSTLMASIALAGHEKLACSCTYAKCLGVTISCGKRETCSCCDNGSTGVWSCVCCTTSFNCTTPPTGTICND